MWLVACGAMPSIEERKRILFKGIKCFTIKHAAAVFCFTPLYCWWIEMLLCNLQISYIQIQFVLHWQMCFIIIIKRGDIPHTFYYHNMIPIQWPGRLRGTHKCFCTCCDVEIDSLSTLEHVEEFLPGLRPLPCLYSVFSSLPLLTAWHDATNDWFTWRAVDWHQSHWVLNFRGAFVWVFKSQTAAIL